MITYKRMARVEREHTVRDCPMLRNQYIHKVGEKHAHALGHVADSDGYYVNYKDDKHTWVPKARFEAEFCISNAVDVDSTYTFQDKRYRRWELFLDRSYYDFICVRLVSDGSMDAPTTFHFSTATAAREFQRLLEESH